MMKINHDDARNHKTNRNRAAIPGHNPKEEHTVEKVLHTDELGMAVEVTAMAYALMNEGKLADMPAEAFSVSVAGLLRELLSADSQRENEGISKTVSHEEIRNTLLKRLAPKTRKRCPKCGGTTFLVTAHVAQDWKVDGDEKFLECIADCTEATHRPDDEDIWACAGCGYEAPGRAFNQHVRQ